MARTTSVQATISSLTEAFARQLASVVEQAAAARIQSAILGGFGGSLPSVRGPGRPPKNAIAALPAFAVPRKKAPKQLCPVPGCKNPAAPVFGMVCAKHKDLPKAKIKKYREDRRAAKLGKTAKAA
jgi:hypothetical protein